MPQMTPREIVRELDKFIVGQQAAKRAVAVALPQDLPAVAALGTGELRPPVRVGGEVEAPTVDHGARVWPPTRRASPAARAYAARLAA